MSHTQIAVPTSNNTSLLPRQISEQAACAPSETERSRCRSILSSRSKVRERIRLREQLCKIIAEARRLPQWDRLTSRKQSEIVEEVEGMYEAWAHDTALRAQYIPGVCRNIDLLSQMYALEGSHDGKLQ